MMILIPSQKIGSEIFCLLTFQYLKPAKTMYQDSLFSVIKPFSNTSDILLYFIAYGLAFFMFRFQDVTPQVAPQNEKIPYIVYI